MTASVDTVLVWAPRGRDSANTVRLLDRHGLVGIECRTFEALLAQLEHADCAILTAENITIADRDAFSAALAQQSPWSDFPIVLFAPQGANLGDRGLDNVRSLGNVTILERPVHGGTLISAVLAALRGRRRQYEARDAIRRRDQFLAMLGHELRNPLGAIVLALETMPPSDATAKHRAIIDRQARHLSRLVDDLLDVARVTSGKVRLDKKPLDLTDVVRRCVQGAELAARTRSIDLTFAGPDAALVVDGDLVRLEEIFNNLISNAIKYSPERTSVEVRLQRDDAGCVVHVIDHGIGIAPEMIPRVFDLFAQAVEALDRSQGGLGIGLTLVKSLVDLHGGTISAESAGLGHGSTFSVRLPCTVAPVLAEVPAPAAAEPRPLRVVLVEDNPDLLDMTAELLQSFGCDVATAADGTSGLALLLKESPDIAFVDIGLPGLDGYGVAESARAKHLGSTLIAMSGYGQPEDRQRALAAGFDRHLTKPVTIATLRDAMGMVPRRTSV